MMERSDAVSVRLADGIAVITLDNPPVNALNQAMRQGLMAAIQQAEDDDSIAGVVIMGRGRAFIAGADIREFGQAPSSPTLPEVIAAIEASTKPVVAAIHGVALGGGLELALGCHYRVADPGAKLGLPEVNLGLIPGAGGTQRLPRAIGLEPAVEMITSGRPATAGEAVRLGLIDALVEGDLAAFAVDFARGKLGLLPPRVGTRDLTAPEDPAFFAKTREKVRRRARGQESPLRALDALEAAMSLPFAEGLARERAIFQELRGSPQSQALRHVFFAERAVAKVPALAGIAPRPLEQVAVIGGGTMGAGIATALLMAKLPVVLIERDVPALAQAQAKVEGNLDGFVARGRLSAADKAARLVQLIGATDYGALADVDLAIEAVFEDLEVKQTVFRQLDAVLKSGTVLASNTSYLDLNAIAGVTARPEAVLGLHFFSPAQVMRLLEVVQGEASAPSTLATGFALAKRLGKIGVLSGVCEGFIGNRILAASRRQADVMIEEGALPWQVDRAMEAFGMAMGPFRVMDLAGLDISWAARKRQAANRDPAQRTAAIADRLCERGWFGRKSGRGWYLYEGEAKSPQPNPEVEALVLAESADKGIARRPFSEDEIQRRILFAMVNEAAKILAEGIAQRPSDIDLVKIHGYGFPRWRGGPLHYADQLGLDRVLAEVRGFAEAAPLLEQLVAEGRSFAALN